MKEQTLTVVCAFEPEGPTAEALVLEAFRAYLRRILAEGPDRA